ncbi:hypothetical protein ABG768_020554 [Culter alburnus]|uniref:Ig-like domain-containing protein n=1 Tax=Culter alburnus TaxID=194366 RepID=A0AAW2AYK5_CULAL
MKNNFKLFQIFLLMCGVFGAGTDEEKTVMEGESVTLNPDLTQIPAFIELLWRFRDSHLVIAQIEENNISYPNLPEMFKDRLKLDQTGSLTITNMKTKHSGLYRLEINHNTGTLNLNFRVTVYESPAVIDAFKGETKSVSVTEGESVTLQTDTETHGDELIVWRFGDEGKLIAKHDLEAKSSPLYDPDERFRDRLKLDNLTGSLTITNTRITDSGVYTVKISSSRQTLYKRFTVTVSLPPLSSGAVAGIVGGVLLVLSAAAGVLYYRHKLSELLKQKNISVKERESLTLTSGIEINKDDEIQWLFGDEKKTVIAEIKRGTGEITVPPDGRFRDRLKIDEKTGSLIITNTRPEDAGVYELRITGDRLVQNLCRRLVQNLNKTFIVHVRDEVNSVSVMKGADVTLRANTEIQTGDKIFWMFGDHNSLVAKNTAEKCEEESKCSNSRFKPDVDLNRQTGDLTIKTIKPNHTGKYKLKIIRNGRSSFKLFSVSVFEQVNKSVLKGRSVTLNYNTVIQKGDKIQWKFGEKLIAEMTGENREKPQWTDEFRDQMKLNPQTGSLIIQQTRSEHSGLYKLEIKTRDYSAFRVFSLIVCDEVKSVSVMKGEDETLRANTEIQTGDKIFWMFGHDNRLVAKNTEEKCEEESEYSDYRFKPKVDLNRQTGDLTIKKIRTDHIGKYKLKIVRNGKSSFKIFDVTVFGPVNKSVLKGRPVTLKCNTEIQKGDKIQWKFGEKLIAEMTGENRGNPQWSDEFRDQMKLNPQTGSLTIEQTRPEHSGLYKLEIKTRDYSTSTLFNLIVFDEEKSVSVMKGADVTLRAKIQTGDKIFWMFGCDNRLVAKNTEEKCEEASEYRDIDNVDLNDQTGDLTIKTIRSDHTGEYKLKIIRNGKSSFKIFTVFVSEQVNESVLKGRSVTLNYYTEIQKDDKIQWKFGEKLIAEMTGENRGNPQWTDEFRDQMKLNPQTGSLIIQQTRSEHSGLYKLEIKTSDYSTFRLFRIIVCAVTDEEERKPLMKEKRENESVTVVMPLLKAEDRDRVNEQESLL